MATLYSLHLSTHKPSFGKPCVHAVPSPGITGNLCPERGAVVVPDRQAVRHALPHYYRAAFDRAGAWWFDRHDSFKPAHVTLRNTRGRYLTTVYAIPYTFNPATGA